LFPRGERSLLNDGMERPLLNDGMERSLLNNEMEQSLLNNEMEQSQPVPYTIFFKILVDIGFLL
jgi:hypothetical protein